MIQLNSTTRSSRIINAESLTARGLAYAELVIQDRDWIDTPERDVTVRLYADGTVTVDGWLIRTDDLADYWVSRCAAHHRAMGERATLVPEIGKREAHALHVTLGTAGIRDHAGYVTRLLGRRVPYLRAISADEARAVRFDLIRSGALTAEQLAIDEAA